MKSKPPQRELHCARVQAGPVTLAMQSTEAWRHSWGMTSWDYYSGSGSLDQMELCPVWDLPYSHAIISALYLAAFAVGMPGNAFVVWLLIRQRGPRRLVDTFVLHLATADLGFVLTLPLWAAAEAKGGLWPFGDGLCKLSSFALAATRCAGALLLAGMSVDRYLAVGRPLRARALRSPRCVRAACCGAWAVAFLAALPALLYRRLQPSLDGVGSQCAEEPSDVLQGLGLLLLLLTFALPLAVTLVFYCRVSRRLPRVGRARSNSLRIIFAVESVFVGSWLPFGILRAVFHLARLRALPLPCTLLLALRWGLAIATCLAFVNSCANPIIYLLLDRSFRARARFGVCTRAGPGARCKGSARRPRSPGTTAWFSGAGPQRRALPRPGSLPGWHRWSGRGATGLPDSPQTVHRLSKSWQLRLAVLTN